MGQHAYGGLTCKRELLNKRIPRDLQLGHMDQDFRSTVEGHRDMWSAFAQLFKGLSELWEQGAVSRLQRSDFRAPGPRVRGMHLDELRELHRIESVFRQRGVPVLTTRSMVYDLKLELRGSSGCRANLDARGREERLQGLGVVQLAASRTRARPLQLARPPALAHLRALHLRTVPRTQVNITRQAAEPGR